MPIPLATFLLLLLISIISSHSLSSLDANSTELSFHNLISSTVLPIKKGPRGDYTVSLKIGNSVQPFNLFIDTGSDLTWVQCDYDEDKQCEGCTMPKDKLYKLKPKNTNLVLSGSPLCAAVQEKPRHPNFDPFKPCSYDLRYVGNFKTQGFLVKDSIPIESSAGTLGSPGLTFGCANYLKVTIPEMIPEGILGLGNGEASILSQLKSKGLIQNVVGHCLSDKNGGGGYLFFGDKFVPRSPRISWTPILNPSKNNKLTQEGRYFSRLTDLIYNEKSTSIKNLELMFDCGTTYSYFNSKDYKVLFDLISSELNSKGRRFTQIKDDDLICWKGVKQFKFIDEVSKEYLKPIILRFSNNVQFQLPVELYITLSRNGNICMAIEDSNVQGFGDDNVIGAFSMHNKIMIFDNEQKRIGWVPDDCTKFSTHR